MKKLSTPMETMIKEATVHEVRVNGEIVMLGRIVAGKVNTVVALMDRNLVTASTPETHGMHWLTEAGMKVWSELTGTEAPEDHPTESDMITDAPVILPDIAGHRWQRHTQPGEAVTEHSTYQAVVADSNCQVSGTVSYQVHTGTWVANGYRNGMSALVSSGSWSGTSLPEALDALAANIAENEVRRNSVETNELPYDAERIFDMENAALEAADIRAEYEAEVAEESNSVNGYINTEIDAALILAEIMTDDRIMILTEKKIFVSQAYMNTMYRIRAYNREQGRAWLEVRAGMVESQGDLFAQIDAVHESGKISFGEADRQKRRIRATCRPSIGSKHKASKHRR